MENIAAEKDPYPIDALPTCNHALSVCQQERKCLKLFEDFKTHCKVRDNKCRMDDRYFLWILFNFCSPTNLWLFYIITLNKRIKNTILPISKEENLMYFFSNHLLWFYAQNILFEWGKYDYLKHSEDTSPK
uniref:GDNF/GAS1 domain-containing protein n=1 Tax=Megaselia scalaris TaxID=36166 RepID=T1GFF4_MEGSC